MTTSRRSFIKISSFGAAGVVLFGSAFKSIGQSLTENNLLATSARNLKRTATYCEVCFWKCAAWAYTDEEDTIKQLIGINGIGGDGNEVYFLNGGDAFNDSIPEEKICKELGIIMIDGIGEKIQSSSTLIENAKNMCNYKKC